MLHLESYQPHVQATPVEHTKAKAAEAIGRLREELLCRGYSIHEIAVGWSACLYADIERVHHLATAVQGGFIIWLQLCREASSPTHTHGRSAFAVLLGPCQTCSLQHPGSVIRITASQIARISFRKVYLANPSQSHSTHLEVESLWVQIPTEGHLPVFIIRTVHQLK